MASSSIGPGKDYATLQAWATARGGMSGTQDAVCYAGNLGGLDLSAFTWQPTTTISVAPGNKHDGTDGSVAGVAYCGRIFITSTGSSPFVIKDLRIDGSLLLNQADGTNGNYLFDSLLIVHDDNVDPVGQAVSLTVGDNGGIFGSSVQAILQNCAVYWVNGTSTFANGLFSVIQEGDSGDMPPQLTVAILNCTFVVAGGSVNYGIWCNKGGGYLGVTLQNTISLGSAVADFTQAGDFPPDGMTAEHNLSSDDTADDLGLPAIINQPLSTVIVSPTNAYLKAGSSAIDAGEPTFGSFSVDIVGTSRPQGSEWDIGCFEYIFVTAAGGGGSGFWPHWWY